tara:strand:- start:135 stop:425 length:291 start_codon:yes stop_codon:yes gene_type:complete
MGFFDMGLPEILLILIVTLIIWGPGKLPEIARTLGKTVRALRKTTSDLTATITKELDMDEKDPPPQSRADSGDKTREPSNAGKTESGDTETASPKD